MRNILQHKTSRGQETRVGGWKRHAANAPSYFEKFCDNGKERDKLVT